MNKKIIYVLLALTVLFVVFFWYQGSIAGKPLTTETILNAIGRITGLFSVLCILLQFLMMGRTLWIERIFGLDKLTNIHRLNGYLSLVFLLLHPIFLTGVYMLSSKKSFYNQFITLLVDYEDVNKALVGLVLFTIVVFTSIYLVRRKIKYEAWYFVHLVTYIAVILAFSHQLELGGDFVSNNLFVYFWYLLYFFVFTNVLLFRFFMPVYRFFYHQFEVNRVVKESKDVVSIYIRSKNLNKFQVLSGQFVFVRFLDRSRFWQSHPFSLSSLPNDKLLRITVKDSGDFTHELSKLSVGTKVLIDGPYGTFTPRPSQGYKYLFIAGGIGITPINAIIQHLSKSKKNNAVLLYLCKNNDDIVFKKELESLTKLFNLKVIYILTENKSFKGEKGRIDIEKIKRLVPDYTSRNIYICGPPQMIKATREMLIYNNVRSGKIHFEKFAL